MKSISTGMLAGTMILALGGGGLLLGQANNQAAEPKDKGMGMMKDMPQSMKLKCRMMMKMEVEPTDPAALLAIKDQLELTEQQTAELQEILAAARAKAAEVLRPNQRQHLEDLADLPSSHMAMHQMMMKKMKAKMTKMGDSREKSGMMTGGNGGMMCPMMQAMQDEENQSDKADMKQKMQEKMERKQAGQDGGHEEHH